ncbi:undecaprenyl-phosphate galactose phosphotransferase [Geothermobacter ehrlichii]|uniref:Undecaprenyl-phosphate galactose phosphotransferase n=1 Tax=Geothermobacter ehrlichii TaxID=213224 RepID=A0A5D3WPE2_9BACT|nr:undecaprenyl-phosphate galactose phosphotransferase WbaP [Geothermobacter ehrlichii]TYP00077.1 undecaprenyl-phosphate galactose phosphotransferase [Geothermobacter ehrlichii]
MLVWTLFLIIVDLVALVGAFFAGGEILLAWRDLDSYPSYLGTWVLCYSSGVPFLLAWFWVRSHYVRRKPFWDELRDLLQGVFVFSILCAAFLYLSKTPFSRLWFLGSMSFAGIFLPLFRSLYKASLLWLGHWRLPVVIIGNGPNAVDAAIALKSERLMGFQIRKFVALPEHDGYEQDRIKVNGDAYPVERADGDILDHLGDPGISNVVVALEVGGVVREIRTIEKLTRAVRNVYIVPALRGLPLYGMEINYFFRHEVLLLRLRNNLARVTSKIVKRSFDLFAALSLMIALAPLFWVLVWLIRRDGAPAIYAHMRIGRGGEEFPCLKFRTMVPDAEAVLEKILSEDEEARREWEASYKLKNDPRITRIGHFLRKTSLDELPQLWNVLRGEMSLVGPRPIIREEIDKYGDDFYFYKVARPGITGLWQVSGRSDIDYPSRVALDVWYVKNWSLWYDIAILFKTIRVVVQRSGAY